MSFKVFSLLLLVRLLCAQYSIIPDCDEVYNYWEPLHYLLFQFGLQTWEYSPEYAIRSWAYELLHAIPLYSFKLLNIDKKVLFFILRYVFAILSTYSETKLYNALCNKVSRKVGQWYILFSALSTGMFHASISFLPSSFAMHMFTLALSFFINEQNVAGMTFVAIGGIWGWPFALAMAVPFGLKYLLTSPFKSTLNVVYKTLINISFIVALIITIDSIFYKKFIFVPINIVLYNVFSVGPDIFGTEPWWYYPLNLTMNFNIIYILAMLSIIASSRRTITLLMPFYLWFGVFIAQPHKEERFMYVLYPALCMNAAFLIAKIMDTIEKMIPALTALKLDYVTILGYGLVSLSRTLALINYYHAPITIFSQLPENEAGNICIGQEWYRYPSSFFLNENQRLKFIESGFDGLLPGEFDELNYPAMHLIPKGMNNLNKEDPGKYTSRDECDFLIDTEYNSDEYEPIVCVPFLNNGKSGALRVIYPGTNLVYDNYCLLRRVKV